MKKHFTFNSYSFGCRVNHAEMEEIDRKLTEEGFVKNSKNPSIYIINTCSVTKKAEREARQLIYKIKRNNPNTFIVVTGCSATYWLKNQPNSHPSVDLMINNKSKQYIVKIIRKRLSKNHLKSKNTVFHNNNPILDKYKSSSRIIIKIQDGCQLFCTYCIVPYLRGSPKSISSQDIINRINSYRDEPNEVIFTAINTFAYGTNKSKSIADLIKIIIKKTHVPRISFGSIHPLSITEEFIGTYKKKNVQKRMVHFFHIPIQSGSDKILRFMKRGYKSRNVNQSVLSIKSINKHAFFATDIIVGFLEETDDDFRQTYEFLKRSCFYKFHVFRYSQRMNTAAYYMSRHLYKPPSHTNRERSLILRELSDQKFTSFQKKLIGYTCKGLILNKKKDLYAVALLNNQVPTLVKYNSVNTGKIKQLAVIDFDKGSLYSRII